MKIAICTPVYGDPSARYVRSLTDLLLFTSESRPDLTLRYFLATGHIIATRNHLAELALGIAPDHLLLIDADMSFPHDGLLTLLGHGHSVVGCNYSTRLPPFRPTARDGTGDVWRDPRKIAGRVVEPVSALGLGFCLVGSAIMRRLPATPFRPHPKNPHGLAEDVQFFEDIRALGETVYLDHALSEKIGHVGEVVHTLADAQKPRGAHRR